VGGSLGFVEDRHSPDGYDDDQGNTDKYPFLQFNIYFFPGDDVRLLPNKFALSIFPCADHRRLSSPSLDRRALVSFPCMLQSL